MCQSASCIYLANKIALNCIDAIFSSFLFLDGTKIFVRKLIRNPVWVALLLCRTCYNTWNVWKDMFDVDFLTHSLFFYCRCCWWWFGLFNKPTHIFRGKKLKRWKKHIFNVYVCMRAFPHSQRVCWMLLDVKYTKSH